MSSQRPPYPLHTVTIRHARLVTPHMKRITIDGSRLSGLQAALPAQWLKVFVALQDGQRSSGRAYTVRRFDPVTLELDIDFVLHGDNGPVSAWAERAEVGDAFEISDVHPRSGVSIEPDKKHYLLFGDETALPAIGAILEALPAHVKAQVFVEVTNAAEYQELTSPALLSVTWLHREDDTPALSTALEAAARAMDIPAHTTAIWAAAESTQIVGLRKLLLKERGVDRTCLHAAGYWKRGEVDHRDEEA